MTGLLDNLADKTENLDQCKGVASAVADLTSNPDQTSSSSRVRTKYCWLIIVTCMFILKIYTFSDTHPLHKIHFLCDFRLKIILV